MPVQAIHRYVFAQQNWNFIHLWSGKLLSNLQANQKNPLVSGMGQSC